MVGKIYGVKIFSDSNIKEVEKKINEWLLEEPRSIKFVTQSESCGSDGGYFTITITIFYEE